MSVPQVTQAEIEAALQAFGKSRTLPAAAYVSERVLDWEREHFYAAGWTCVGRASDVAEGSYRAVTAGNDSLLLSRAAGGELKAFFNVCRHRGHELLPCGSSAAAKVIKCPYHGWTYGLDGALNGAPHFGDQPDFDAGDYPLIEARTHEWGGWVFVNVSGDAPDFNDYTGSLQETIAPYQPERLVIAARDEYVVGANWKSIIENYHECYHCNHIHPELVQVSSPVSGHTWYPDGAWVGGDMELLEGMKTMSMDGQTGANKMLPGLEGKQLRDVLYFELFPNLLISPHPDYILTHRFEPLEPGLTKVECHWLFDAGEVARDDFDPSYAVDFWDITNKQDWSATEGVQRGMHSKGYTPGPLSSVEETVYQAIYLAASGYKHGRINLDDLAKPSEILVRPDK